eukprot:g16753.t1
MIELFEVLRDVAKSDATMCDELAFDLVNVKASPSGPERRAGEFLDRLPGKLVDAKSPLLHKAAFVANLVVALSASFKGPPLDPNGRGLPQTRSLEPKRRYEGFQKLLRYPLFLHDASAAQVKAIVLRMIKEDVRVYLDILRQVGTCKLGPLVQDQEVILTAIRGEYDAFAQFARGLNRVFSAISGERPAMFTDVFRSVPYTERSEAACVARIDGERDLLKGGKKAGCKGEIKTKEDLFSYFEFLSMEIPERVQRSVGYKNSRSHYLYALEGATPACLLAGVGGKVGWKKLVDEYLPHQNARHAHGEASDGPSAKRVKREQER